MEIPSTLTFRRGEWSQDARLWLVQALQFATVAEIRHQIDHCGAQLYYIEQYGGITNKAHIVGAFVLRVDHGPDGSEGVIVAAAGSIPGHDLIEICLPQIERLFVGCVSIRYHTARAALARRLVSHGYQSGEIVCRKKLKNEPVAA